MLAQSRVNRRAQMKQNNGNRREANNLDSLLLIAPITISGTVLFLHLFVGASRAECGPRVLQRSQWRIAPPPGWTGKRLKCKREDAFLRKQAETTTRFQLVRGN